MEHLQELFDKTEEDAYNRHTEGAEKYGALGFLGKDTLQELYEEILDLINYGRYTAVKVKLLQEALARSAADVGGTDTTGAFVPTSELMKKEFKPE